MSILGFDFDVRSVVAALIAALAIQAIFGLIWLTRLGDSVEQLQTRDTSLNLRIDSLHDELHNIDTNGSRALILIRDRQDGIIRQMERLVVMDSRLNKIEAQIETAIQTAARLEDQQRRIIQALDNTYETLNKYMREHGESPPERPPPAAPRPF